MYLASDAVEFLANITFERVDLFRDETPTSAIRGLALEGVLRVGLGLSQTLLLKLFINILTDELKVEGGRKWRGSLAQIEIMRNA